MGASAVAVGLIEGTAEATAAVAKVFSDVLLTELANASSWSASVMDWLPSLSPCSRSQERRAKFWLRASSIV